MPGTRRPPNLIVITPMLILLVAQAIAVEGHAVTVTAAKWEILDQPK